MQRTEEPLAAAVAGEHASGAVRPVRTRRQTDDDQASAGVAEAGNRPAPILLVGVCGAPLGCDPLSPLDEPRTTTALDEVRRQSLQRRGHSGRKKLVS
jgi:hypothetical protein